MKAKKVIALLHTGMLKCVKTFNSIHSLSCEWGINFLKGFPFRYKKWRWKKRIRDIVDLRSNVAVLYRKRKKPLGRNLSTFLMIWVEFWKLYLLNLFCNFHILLVTRRVFWTSIQLLKFYLYKGYWNTSRHTTY